MAPKAPKKEKETGKPNVLPESLTPPEASAVPERKPMTAGFDVCLYHREYAPRVFKSGEVIPEGWTGPEGILRVIWDHDAYGNWFKVK